MKGKSTLFDAPRVGGDILFHCSRCNLDLAHVVVSMVDGLPAKILCKTCQTPRMYRRSSSASLITTTKRSPSVRTGTHGTSGPRLWEAKMQENANKLVRDYDTKVSYASGELVQHKLFGIGVVEEVKRNDKITVLFRDGFKVLIHQRQST